MGEARKDALRLGFDRRLKLKFLGSKVTTDAGLLAYRELDEAFALTEMVQNTFEDSRLGSNKQHQLVPLLRQSTNCLSLAAPRADAGARSKEIRRAGGRTAHS